MHDTIYIKIYHLWVVIGKIILLSFLLKLYGTGRPYLCDIKKQKRAPAWCVFPPTNRPMRIFFTAWSHCEGKPRNRPTLRAAKHSHLFRIEAAMNSQSPLFLYPGMPGTANAATTLVYATRLLRTVSSTPETCPKTHHFLQSWSNSHTPVFTT